MIDQLHHLQIETTTACNAACGFCPHPRLQRAKGRMRQELFEKLVRDADDLGVRHYFPFFMGEPLADPRLLDWLQYLKAHGAEATLYTNAQLLTPAICDRLLALGNLRAIFVSFYGATKTTYEAAMQGLHFETSKANAEYLLQQLEAVPYLATSPPRHLPAVHIRMSSYELTAPEVDAFRAMWGRYALVARHANWAGETPSSHAPLDLPQWPCNRIMDHAYVLHDGRVCLCCMDHDGKHIIGDVTTTHLGDIWAAAQTIRDQHRAYQFDQPLCQTCSVNRYATDPWGGRYPRPEAGDG